MIATLDFETYSEAGYIWNESTQKWEGMGTAPYGLPQVGAAVYAEHPSTEVLSLAYDLKDGLGSRLWLPGMLPPQDLFTYISGGGLIEAHNSGFEWFIWSRVCAPRMGWAPLSLHQLRCSMSKTYAWGLPGKLLKAAQVLGTVEQKDAGGTRLLNKFTKPRNPTKKDPRKRILPHDDPIDGPKLWAYNLQDIRAEEEVSSRCPSLSEYELEVWLADQAINERGIHVDLTEVSACISIIEQTTVKYTAELKHITGGEVGTASEIKKMREWLEVNGLLLPNLQAETVEKTLKRGDLSPVCRRVLEIRASLSASSVAKVYAMRNRASAGSRLRGLFIYHGTFTGRWAGRGIQPQNLPATGPDVKLCPTCGAQYSAEKETCPSQGYCVPGVPVEWDHVAVERALKVLSTGDLTTVEHYYNDALAVVSGAIRGLLSASPGGEFIDSDYSAIEAVVLAEMAGEEWRKEVFRTHGKIYEQSAARITGRSLKEFEDYKTKTGNHHPDRKKGKVAELALGYQGGVGALKSKNFRADEYLSEEEMRDLVSSFRKASPLIVKMWYALQDRAVDAVRFPGTRQTYRGVTYFTDGGVLYCELLSGRLMAYHSPMVTEVQKFGRLVFELSYMRVDPKTFQWTRTSTYGGKLTENMVQATAREILAHAILNLERVGYPVVAHIHDEILMEVAEGTGSIEEVEAHMGDLPEWCATWPVKASGGWRGKRFRKD